MKNKYFLHSFQNIIIVPVILAVIIFTNWLIIVNIIGTEGEEFLLMLLVALLCNAVFIFILLTFIYRHRILDYLKFENDKIILCSFFKKSKSFLYEDYIAVIGRYTSIMEDKQYIILTPKSLNGVCTEINVSKWGNCIAVNKANILYCKFHKPLFDFLEKKFSILEKQEEVFDI